MMLNTWRHIGCTREVAEHPHADVGEDDNDVDPFAMHKGDPNADPDDKAHNTEESLNWWKIKWQSFLCHVVCVPFIHCGLCPHPTIEPMQCHHLHRLLTAFKHSELFL